MGFAEILQEGRQSPERGLPARSLPELQLRRLRQHSPPRQGGLEVRAPGFAR